MNRQLNLFSYPRAPGFKRYGTSQQAADKMQPHAANLRDRSLAAIKGAGRHGLTADEVAAILMRSEFSIRPRISELLVMGAIVRNGERRKNSSGLCADAYIAKET